MIVVQNIFLSLMILSSVYFSILDIKSQKIPRLYSYIFIGFSLLGGIFVGGILLQVPHFLQLLQDFWALDFSILYEKSQKTNLA